MSLFNQTFLTLERSLDYSTMKNRIISKNIANVDTPNYKAKDVYFKDVLAQEISKGIVAKKTHPKHLNFSTNPIKPYVIQQKNHTLYNHNGNNVDMDVEMSELAKNQIYYEGLVDRINGKFTNLQTVLRGGS